MAGSFFGSDMEEREERPKKWSALRVLQVFMIARTAFILKMIS